MKKIVFFRDNTKKYAIIVGIVCLAVVLGVLLIPGTRKKTVSVDLTEHSSVSAICELATLKSYYHNVVVYEEKQDGIGKAIFDALAWPFDKLIKAGYKQFWIEYSGIVETGIDASLVKVSSPDGQGVVEVYVPDAKVLGVYADENSLTQPITEQGWFTTITGEEKAAAFTEAQQKMRSEAENDSAMLARAKENAKLLLERYVVNTGKQIGKSYTVRWVEKQ